MSEREKRVRSLQRKQKYKEILDRGASAVEESEGRSLAENLNIIEAMLTDSNKLIEEGNVDDRIGHTTEVLMDVQAVKMACDLMSSTVQQIDNDKFSDEQYAAAIMGLTCDKNGQTDWFMLDEVAAGVFKTFRYTPALGDANIQFTAELNDSESTVQKQRQPRKKSQLASETKPMSLTQQQIGNKDIGSAKLQEINKQINALYENNNHEPIPYYKLIIDPQNMMYTFDNAFQLSFLFRDGFIGFVQDNEKMPAIRVVSKAELKAHKGENVQFITTLNARKISKMIEKYGITEPMLKLNRELYEDTDESQ